MDIGAFAKYTDGGDAALLLHVVMPVLNVLCTITFITTKACFQNLQIQRYPHFKIDVPQ
jgi:hypothetical protein